MKVAASTLLIFLFVPLFLIGVLAATVRFQVLDSNFWLSTFSQNNVYANLADVIKKSAEDRTVVGGGSKTDAKVLTNLISPDNVQDIVSRNLLNLLGFVNGSSKELDIYFPVDKVPKGLLPEGLGVISDTIPITTLLNALNVQGFGPSQLKVIGSVGFWSTALLVLDFILLLIILVLLYILVVPGRRFVNLGIGLLLSGLIVLASFVFGETVRTSAVVQWSASTEFFQKILSTFSPIILQKILFLWLFIGAVSVALGVLLFFLKKRVYNKR